MDLIQQFNTLKPYILALLQYPQQIYNNLYIYLLDLDREESKNITLNLYILGDDFKQKLAYICGAITQIQKRTHSNETIFELFFKLKQLLET
ncbi:6788_t:CDS:2 [Racocetra fulgida]|uniref:6788_t:CDS:1 n=1 Tax=Racocetra fulgida TaxID=60492 RepID=A0A9N8ZDZ2_9GLOM|nr:6788_t:CDS:2 [Racocetra fulgida]